MTDTLSLTFEQALTELEKVVRQLEEGKLPLDDSIKLFERGTNLKSHCETLLKSAKMRIEQITNPVDGSLKIMDPAAAA
jgi:exodeoxyribonuclease VII small subunit